MVEKGENPSPLTDRIKLSKKEISCFIVDLLLFIHWSNCALIF